MAQVTMLSPKDANKLVEEKKAQMVDIRTVGEILSGEIANSIYLPFDLITAHKLHDAGLDEKIPVLVCRSGIRAQQAAEALAEEMHDVAVLDGGVVQWQKDGLPMTKGHYVMPLERQVLVTAGSMIFMFTVLGLLVSPVFYALNILMTAGMIFAGISGACGMARLLVMMPWNRKPLCGQVCDRVELGNSQA